MRDCAVVEAEQPRESAADVNPSNPLCVVVASLVYSQFYTLVSHVEVPSFKGLTTDNVAADSQ